MRWAPLLGLLALASGCRSAEPKPGPEAGASAQAVAPYELTFEGNSAFSAGKLRDQIAANLAEFERSGLERSYIDDAAFDLELFYLARGFPDVVTLYEVVPAADGRPALVTIHVEEGPRTVVKSVNFVGNEVYTEEQLLDFLDGRRQGFLSSGALYYVASAAREAREQIFSAYQGLGYRSVNVELGNPVFSSDRTEVTLTYTITEGPRYRLGTVDVTGDPPLDEQGNELVLEEWRKLVAELEASGDVPLDPRAPFRMKSRIIEVLGAAGYADAEVDVRRTLAEDGAARVDVELHTTLGPRITLSGVRFEGIDKVDENLVRKLVKVDPGGPADMVAIRQGVADLYATGFFKRVGQELVPTPDQGEHSRELVVSVEEYVPLELYVEPGYGSYEGLRLRVGFRDRNLFGRRLDLSGDAKVSVRDVRGNIKLTNPNFLDKGLEAGVTLTAGEREEPTFTSREIGAGLFLTRSFSERASLTTGYQLRSTDASDVSSTQATANDIDISSVRLDYRYDSRRSILGTSSGFYGTTGLEYGDEAIHSDLDFWRFQAQIAWFARLTDTTFFGVRFRGGLIQPRGGDQIPVQEQYFNGGQNSVRSFRQSELARDPMGIVIGGEAANTISLELRQRLVGDLEGALFYDRGNVSLRAESPFDNDFLGEAIGVGLRYQLPIGALRLDVGFNPDPGPFDEDFVIHFAVGNPF